MEAFVKPHTPEELVQIEIQQWRVVAAEWGPLVHPALAAKLCGVSSQRVLQMISSGKLNGWQFFGKEWVSLPQLQQYRAAQKDKGGRPRKQAA